MASSQERRLLSDHELIRAYQERFPDFHLPPILGGLPPEWRARLVRALARNRPDLTLHREGLAARELERKGVRF